MPGTTDKKGQCRCYPESLCGDIISPLHAVTGGWISNSEAFQKICEIVGIWYLTIWISGNVGTYGICAVCINFSYVFSMYGFYPHIIFSYLYHPLWSPILFVYEWQLHTLCWQLNVMDDQREWWLSTKSTCCSCRGPGFNFWCCHRDSWQAVFNSSSKDLVASDLHRYRSCTSCTYIHLGKIFIYIT